MSADMTIEEFFARHRACRDGRDWALSNCATMQNAWDSACPEWLIWLGTRPGVLGKRQARLFAVFCGRQVRHLMTDSRSLAALDVAERHARGEATDEELASARAAAVDAARASDASRAAAGAAAGDAWASSDAASHAVWAAAGDAWADPQAARAASLAAMAAAQAAQAAWLRENTRPDFTRRAEA